MYNLVTTITELPKLVGCHDFPNDQQGMQLIKLIQDFINNEYKYDGKTVTEAFRMAVKRELYLDGKRVDPSTFGQYLSLNVVGQVLTSYKESKQSKNARPTGYNFNQLPEHRTVNISDADAWDLVLKWTKQEKQLPFAAPYLGAYRYLVKNGVIKPHGYKPSNRFEANLSGKEKEAVEMYLIQNVLKG